MESKDLDTLHCADCGSSDVEMTMWVNPNTEKISCQTSDRFEEEDCWCNNCSQHVKLFTLEELWKRFSAIPVNNDDEIEDDFLLFPVGTSKFDVWHWFDERCPNSLHDDLMDS